jgi:putative salt-induced outer membrane protein YdiY
MIKPLLRYFALRLFLFHVLVFSGFGWGGAKKPPLPARWKGDVSMGLSLSRGNTHTTNFSFTFSAGGPLDRAKSKVWSNKGIFLLGELNGETRTESLLYVSRVDWKHKEGLFSYYEFQAIRDRFRNYSYRLLPALGAGYDFLASETFILGVDLGLAEVLTKYYESGLTESYSGLKTGQDLDWRISETAEFNQKLEINYDISNFSNFFVRLEANLITAISKGWSVKLTFIDGYVNEPVGEDIGKNDITFITGISRKF